MSPDYIGRNPEDVVAGAGAATTAADGTGTTHTRTVEVSQRTATEVGAGLHRPARPLRQPRRPLRCQRITMFNTTVMESTWTGAAKTQATQTAENLRRGLDTISQQTATDIEGFRTWMLNQSQGLTDEVQTTLGSLLTDYGSRYEQLSSTLDTFNAEMEMVETTGAARLV